MTSWYHLPQIEYYAGRYFTHDGVDYVPGQKLTQDIAHKFPALEAAIRSRYLIPIAPDRHVIPRHMWAEALTYETALARHQERAHRLNLPALEESGAPASAEYDPADHTVEEVKDHVEAHPDQAEEILEAEEEGKDRVTLTEHLEDAVPFDPGEYKIRAVLEYVDENPSETEAVLEAERDGKGRVTLIEALEERLTEPGQ